MSEIHPTDIQYIEIFPPIGIARVGNSKEYYIGPEIPGRNDTPDAGTPNEGFKDQDLKVKRQAARFRVYAFGKNHQVLGELNSNSGFDLEWTVELANKKPSWYAFMGRTQPGAFQPGNTTLRNPTVQPTLDPDQRTDCIIAPGPKTIKTGSTETVDMTGQFKGSAPNPVDVYLGSIKLDDQGRLLVLPGNGFSRCIDDPEDPYPLILTDFDNPNWVDDTCDGTIQVRVNQGKYSWAIAHTAHVVCTTPKYASAIYAPTTLYDVMENIYAKEKGNGDVNNVVGEVEYWRDIWELIKRPVLLSWVNGQANSGHGPSRMGNFFDPEWQKKLQSTSPEDEATRKIILGRMRLPYIDDTEVARQGQAFKYFMPWLSGDGGRTTAGDPTTFASVTELQFARLTKWADGDFVVNPKNRPKLPAARFEDIPLQDQPVSLTRANLEWTIGAPLYPGIELSWNAEMPETYDLSCDALALGPLGYRIKNAKPGDLTRYLSLPWQSDFYMCRNYWWPSARPDAILSKKVLDEVTQKYGWEEIVKVVSLSQKKQPSEVANALANHVPWERGIHQNYTDVYSSQPLFANTDMAKNWHKLGFIVGIDPPVKNIPVQDYPTLPIFVETQRQHPHPKEMKTGDDLNLKLPAFALYSQAQKSFEAHAISQKIEFRMPLPDNRATKPKLAAGHGHGPGTGKWGLDFKNPPITTLDSLKRHLHFAMAVELSTIPLYLYAMYSIKLPADKVKDPLFWDPVTGAIRGVVAEEMLHLSLAGNVLKAIGGEPKLYSQLCDTIKIFPTYGMIMPGRIPRLEMNLRQATKPNFDTFLGIELPQRRDDPPGGADEYHTLGQFYDALKDGLKCVSDQLGEKNLFKQDSLPYQFAPGTGYQPRIHNAGGSIVVKDLKTAREALDVIVEQGEGREPTEFAGDELAHYYVFKGLQEGPLNWDVYPVPENPTTQMYAELGLEQIYQVSRTFDAAYCYLLLSIEKLWETRDEDERRKLVLANMYSLMIGVLAPLAKFLVTQPLNDKEVAAPCFNWYEFSTDKGKGTPFKQLRMEMKATMVSYVQVTAETDDQVPDHDYGAQIQALIPVQTALDGMLDINTFERPTGKIGKKELGVPHTQGLKGFN